MPSMRFSYVLHTVSGAIDDISYTRPSALQGYCAASSGNFLLTFRDNLSVPSSGVKNKNKTSFSSTSRRKPETTHISYSTNMSYILFSITVVLSLV